MPDIPYGYCHCGCGEKTEIAAMTQRACGWVKGEPKRFVFNHHRRRHVDEYYTAEDRGYTTPCWLWQGTTCGGYGHIYRDGRVQKAHRYYYEQTVGPIPDGAQLDHLCRVRACVNPDHLEPVTQKENIRRGFKARPKRTHCKRGHEFTPENTIMHPNGGRMCRTCINVKQLERYHARKKRAAE